MVAPSASYQAWKASGGDEESKRLYDRVMSWFRPYPPPSILKPPPKPPSGTEKLYVLHVDFPVDPTRKQMLADALAVYERDFGLRFFVIEPGMKLTKFDDI